MNILLTGKLDSITGHIIAAAGSNHRIIVAAKTIPDEEHLPNNVRPFSIGPNDPLFERVTKVGSFDAAVFFMARGEHADKTEGGTTAFQSLLEHCKKCGVEQIILVSSGEVYSGLPDGSAISEETAANPKGAQGLEIKAAEDICVRYFEQTEKKITVVRLPYIYRRENAAEGDGLLSKFFRAKLENRHRFDLPGSAETRCDFLSDVEAARLVWLIIDEGISTKSVFINAGTGKSVTMGDIANLAAEHFPDMQIRFTGETADVPPPMRTRIAKSEYGWNALHSLSDDFDDIIKTVTAVPVKKFLWIPRALNAVKKFFRGSTSFIVVEFIVSTALLQLLTTALRGFTFAYWIDLRLLFVVILATLHGTIPGIVAGAIAGVMLFFTMGGTDWRLIVYNPENWIPFATYVIMGVALGSRADRQSDTLISIRSRLDLAEQTNVYLVDLYDEAVKIKDQYRDQILGYKDNFGRIYSIVKKLNSEMSEYVFSSAIDVIEDVLQNKTVAVYSMSSRGDYARMTVCSKALTGAVRSLRMHDYRQIMDKMDQHDIWFNRDLIQGFPTYCAPVYNEEKLIALVMIWRAEVDQMTLHYSNLFRILSGLIQESLVRAVKFNELRESTAFFPDTRILMKDAFFEAFKANLALVEKEKADFGLITVARTKDDLTAQNSQLEACIRESDVVGAVNDKLFCVILKNVGTDDVKALLKRFSSRHMKAKQVTIPDINGYMIEAE